MGTASSGEWIAILLYFALVIGVGVYFFFRDRNVEGEKEYFLGGRSMGGWVAALSAGASDMSAWVLMGLPGSIYLYGIGKVWIAVGLVIGTICAWVFVAPRLRRYSIRANDSITIPQFLTNRFQSKNKGLQIISAIVFVVVYCIYSASSISACGTLFNTVTGMSAKTAMIIATAIILVYVFLGGFNAVCWTDFFQGMLMLAALMLTPILALFAMKGADFVAPVMTVPENYFNPLSGGGFNWKSVSDILSGLGWGLGYFGMPHILVRYLSIKSEHEMRKSQIIGCSWIVLILAMSAVVGQLGRQVLGEIDNENRRLSLGHKQLEENPWNEFENQFSVDSIHEGTITEMTDKGAVVALGENVEGFCPARQLTKEDGTTPKVGDKLDFKVLEFSKATKRITLSHLRTYEEAKRAEVAAEKAEKRAAADATKSTVKKINASVEKTTLGDIAGLAALKSAMEAAEAKNAKKAAKEEKAEE